MQRSNANGRSDHEGDAAEAVTLLLTARVREEKRAEFLLSARSLGPVGGFVCFEGVDDSEHVCAMARIDGAAGASYLGSDRFRALKGALRTLTSGWDVSVLCEREGWCAPSRRDG